MIRRPAVVILALSCGPVGGCGTLASLADPPPEGRTFGGVRQDLAWVERLGEPTDRSPLAGSSGTDGAIAAAFLLLGPFADLPLSLAGDILLYPLTSRLDGRGETPAGAAPRPTPPRPEPPAAGDTTAPGPRPVTD